MVASLNYSSQSKFESQRSSCQPDHHPSYERATDGAGKSGDNVSIPILVIHSPFSRYDRTEYICQKDNFLKSQYFGSKLDRKSILLFFPSSVIHISSNVVLSCPRIVFRWLDFLSCRQVMSPKHHSITFLNLLRLSSLFMVETLKKNNRLSEKIPKS